jgi:hypothetical protein
MQYFPEADKGSRAKSQLVQGKAFEGLGLQKESLI